MKINLKFDQVTNKLKSSPKVWMITGVAGFIGSNLLEFLLSNNQFVIGVDNFSTGHKKNLDDVKSKVLPAQWKNFIFNNVDIREFDQCVEAFESLSKLKISSIDYVLHQAAIGSVPRSIEDPIFSHSNNISGFLNILYCAKENNIKKFVYATSSSVYGDETTLPKIEDKTGNLLSPYALTKLSNELYAKVFGLNYEINTIGLRYFNVFGPRQDPEGAYAAVIPKWIDKFIKNETVEIYGDGDTTRDFCFIENVIQANILAAVCKKEESRDQVFNIAVGSQITLTELALLIKDNLREFEIKSNFNILYSDFRKGDIRHSLANIDKASKILNYIPSYDVAIGLNKSMNWYLKNNKIKT